MSNFPVTYEERKSGTIAIVSIKGIEPNNTLDLNMIRGLTETLNNLDKADAVLLTSEHPKFFSNGIDGKHLQDCDESGRIETVSEMIKIFGKLIAFEKPFICEISGYAMAGGAVIASTADYRYMLSGAGRIGFSELAVGLPLPMVYVEGLHRFVAPDAIRNLMEGAALKPDEALSIGLIDGIADSPEKLRKMSFKKIDSILRLEQESYLATRNLYRKTLLKKIEVLEPEDIEMAAKLVKMPVFQRAIDTIAGKNR